jgi:hypothetical protein
MLSDEFSDDFETQASFAKSIVLWAVKARGVIQEKGIKHHLVGSTESSAHYTIKEMVHYEMDIAELVNGEWVPFKVNF